MNDTMHERIIAAIEAEAIMKEKIIEAMSQIIDDFPEMSIPAIVGNTIKAVGFEPDDDDIAWMEGEAAERAPRHNW